MNAIPGSFTYVDVMFNNNSEPALLLESTAGFATLTFGPLPMGGATPTGLANDATEYYVKHEIDAAGSATEVNFAGSTAQTFATLVTALETALGGAATTVALVGDSIVVTSATTGNESTVVITAGTTGRDLLSSIKGNSFKLQANVTTRGHDKYLRWEALDDLEQKELLATMNGITTGEANWVYASDKITVTDTTFTATTAIGLAAATYSLGVTVDGVAKQVSFAVAGVSSTMTDVYNAFVAAMAVAFPNAVVSMTDAANVVTLIVTSGVPGPEGSVAVVDGSTNGFIAQVDALASATLDAAVAAGVTGAVGTAGTKQSPYDVMSWFAALNTVKAPNGFPVLSSVGPVAIVERENKPTMRYIPRADGTYWSGSAWVVWTA